MDNETNGAERPPQPEEAIPAPQSPPMPETADQPVSLAKKPHRAGLGLYIHGVFTNLDGEKITMAQVDEALKETSNDRTEAAKKLRMEKTHLARIIQGHSSLRKKYLLPIPIHKGGYRVSTTLEKVIVKLKRSETQKAADRFQHTLSNLRYLVERRMTAEGFPDELVEPWFNAITRAAEIVFKREKDENNSSFARHRAEELHRREQNGNGVQKRNPHLKFAAKGDVNIQLNNVLPPDDPA